MIYEDEKGKIEYEMPDPKEGSGLLEFMMEKQLELKKKYPDEGAENLINFKISAAMIPYIKSCFKSIDYCGCKTYEEAERNWDADKIIKMLSKQMIDTTTENLKKNLSFENAPTL